MLVIISDLHLSDGTCGKSIPASAFDLFADRLRELAINASLRAGGEYRPIEAIDVLMLGDVLDVLNSQRWLDTKPYEADYARPWTDTGAPGFVHTVDCITEACLHNNSEGISTLHQLSENGVSIPSAGSVNARDCDAAPTRVNVRIHYMAGNHDRYYHLPGAAYDEIRAKIVDALGLANAPKPFPHEIDESDEIKRLLDSYGVYARHGDVYDSFNYGSTYEAAGLGDVLAVEVFNRFPIAVRRELGRKLPPELVDSLTELRTVRPVVAMPLWLNSQCRVHDVREAELTSLKELWDRLCSEFLQQPLVRAAGRKRRLQLELAIKITREVSLRRIDDLVVKAHRRFSVTQQGTTLYSHALEEEAFQRGTADFIVYGHSHHHEVVPLDSVPATPHPANRMYLNSGVWHTYYDLAVHRPEEQRFIPSHVMTYLAFFGGDERAGRRFEAWSGAFAD